MGTITSIIAGWKGVTFGNEKMKPIAFERAKHCADCPKNVASFCTACGCHLPAKTMSPYEKCPKGKWQALDDPDTYL